LRQSWQTMLGPAGAGQLPGYCSRLLSQPLEQSEGRGGQRRQKRRRWTSPLARGWRTLLGVRLITALGPLEGTWPSAGRSRLDSGRPSGRSYKNGGGPCQTGRIMGGCLHRITSASDWDLGGAAFGWLQIAGRRLGISVTNKSSSSPAREDHTAVAKGGVGPPCLKGAPVFPGA